MECGVSQTYPTVEPYVAPAPDKGTQNPHSMEQSRENVRTFGIGIPAGRLGHLVVVQMRKLRLREGLIQGQVRNLVQICGQDCSAPFGLYAGPWAPQNKEKGYLFLVNPEKEDTC